ncbi:DUF663-domain-containing protein [Tilletiaria anomala UBC 951]|uniref:DUF663-domain-containing protein n=1 Tax=Tilletiaria anomala (strain ATCC 24038 / CBS 436.72 / UBC 951) TaxID=1037660 RepID=A0A066WF31_TILAU|nr:DUF663-domain-containing protein [Tilletiaria anomala UBC 951]KDN52587.1 DUF663-domain-containing protein [Tilletiaria anomala UBC 951]
MAGGKGGNAPQQHHHRSQLSQTNKAFKSRHATKGSIKTAAKGRQEGTQPRVHKASPLGIAATPQGARQARRNLAKQTQQSKRAALVESTRIFGVGAGSSLAGTLGLGKGTAASGGGAPRICAVIDLAGGVAWDAVRMIEEEGEEGGIKPVPGRSSSEARQRGDAFSEIEATRFRQTIQFLPLPYGALWATLDACKCADFVLCVLSSTKSIEPGSWGELCLRALQAQGLPSVLIAVSTLNPQGNIGVGGSKKAGPVQRAVNETRKSLLSFAQYFAPEVEKVHSLDDRAERSALIRTLATSTPRRVAWRDFRAWTVSEGAEWVPSPDAASGSDAKGTLKIEGWVRGTPMSANRLVHIPDFGDFRFSKITYAPPSTAARYPRRNGKKEQLSSTDGMDAEMASGEVEPSEGEEKPLEGGDVLDERDDEYADDMRSTNEVDDMANEQTWPTEEEIASATGAAQEGVSDASLLPPAVPGITPRSIAKYKASTGGAPKLKGESAPSEKWKAAWIIESDEEDDEDDEDDEDKDEAHVEEDGEHGAEAISAPAIGPASSMKPSTSVQVESTDAALSDVGMEEDDYDEDEERAAWEAYQERRQREKEEREDAEFPDEVDTPMDIPARQRFARYRGLKSFRTSPWDPYEDLPRDYGRIYQFDNYGRTARRVEAAALVEGVQPGVRVCLWIEDVPREAAVRAQARGAGELPELQEGQQVPFVVFGLLRHEHKKSVLHMTVTRNTEYEEPVRSKDPLVLCLGPRRFRVNPIYSQNTLGSGKRSNGAHKFERYLAQGISGSVATVYAPITFGGSNAPAVLFRERDFAAGECGHDQRGVGARQTPHLVGMGSLLGAQPTRINAKRIFLTGHPYKVHKKTATIRFMFFNADDVRYFKPIMLHTKHGKTGHIREPLGTHGYMKAHFDGPISQMDTVLLPLYKRVFPKWAELFTSSREEMPLPRSQVKESEDEDAGMKI